MLKNNKGDIGFVNLPLDDSDINLSDTVMQLHDTFVASEKFNELFGEVVDLKRLQDYPLLMLEQNTITRKEFNNFTTSSLYTIITSSFDNFSFFSIQSHPFYTTFPFIL